MRGIQTKPMLPQTAPGLMPLYTWLAPALVEVLDAVAFLRAQWRCRAYVPSDEQQEKRTLLPSISWWGVLEDGPGD